MSEVTRLICEESRKLGAPENEVLRIVEKFKSHWYNTVRSLLKMTDERWEEFRLPWALEDALKKKLEKIKRHRRAASRRRRSRSNHGGRSRQVFDLTAGSDSEEQIPQLPEPEAEGSGSEKENGGAERRSNHQ